MAARNHIELIEKTFRVLEAIADSESGLTLSTLAARSSLVKSSTFRILFTLGELGYVEKSIQQELIRPRRGCSP